MADARSRLLFKFWSGTHGLNEELGRHRGREGNKECELCGNECESVSFTHLQYDCIYYVAPPVKMGAWSITCVLRQQIYYYYYFITGNTRDTDE